MPDIMRHQLRKEWLMTIRKRSLPRGWYPYTESQCREQIESFTKDFVHIESQWLGGIAPHAGWDFSGRGAARVFSTIARGSAPDCVVIYGGHLSSQDHPIIYTEQNWETPCGMIAMQTTIVKDILNSRAAQPAHPRFADNTVEVLLPFVRFFFPRASLVAVHSPASERAIKLGEVVADFIQSRKLEAVYIASADLTHYGPNYGFAPMGTGLAAVKWVKEENDKSI